MSIGTMTQGVSAVVEREFMLPSVRQRSVSDPPLGRKTDSDRGNGWPTSTDQTGQVGKDQNYRGGEDDQARLPDFALLEHGRMPFFLLAGVHPALTACRAAAPRLGVEDRPLRQDPAAVPVNSTLGPASASA